MSDADRLLEIIEEGVTRHGGDLGGWTQHADGRLKLFDGRVTLRAEITERGDAAPEGMVHAHVLTTLHEYDDEILDACLMGAGDKREQALAQAAAIWITAVAGPIKSFIDNKPICMTCQAGVQGGNVAEGYSQGDYGLPGLRAYVGPWISRGVGGGNAEWTRDDTKPWFRFAAESAAPRRVHLAKATIAYKGKEGWTRDLEVDGHDVSYHEANWPAGVTGTELGYATRFAVFEFPANSAEIRRRAELERTICYFAQNFTKYESVDQLMQQMVGQGFDADLVHEVESISTIAFSRTLFEHHGVPVSPTVIRARADGRVESDVPLMSLPAYKRARALASAFRETMSKDDFLALCLYNAESHGIMHAIEASGGKPDFARFKLFPLVVPDRGVSDRTMDAAMALLHRIVDQDRPDKKKPWWKFW